MIDNSPVFAIVAGEASGDILGADLIRSLKKLFPSASFEGIGGPQMQAEGLRSLFDMERLSVMGFIEPLKRLPELLRMRRTLVKRYQSNRPSAFIGIDAPDFNLGIEKKLRKSGVKTVHYVSPSVWAWRQGRIKKIKRSVDLMLTLLPFEEAFYRQHQVKVCFVGHPLASQFSDQPDTMNAREQLGFSKDKPLLTIMPGSRSGEIDMMAELFLDVAEQLRLTLPDLQLLIPAANMRLFARLTELMVGRSQLQVRMIEQQSHLAMEAADVVLLTSGTTALEAMLLKKPMVVSYRMGKWSFRLLSRLVKVPFVSLPNLLAGEALVPELLQDDATVERLTNAVLESFSPQCRQQLEQRFMTFHQQLKMNSGELAAVAITDLVNHQ